MSNLLHTTLSHLERGEWNYVRMLFIDFGSAFNMTDPLTKMKALGLNTTLSLDTPGPAQRCLQYLPIFSDSLPDVMISVQDLQSVLMLELHTCR